MNYSLSNSPLQKLIASGRQHQFAKGQVINFSDNGMLICMIDTGFVKRYSITNDGSHSIQSIYGNGGILPLTPVFMVLFDVNIYSGQEDFYYETMTPTTLHSIDRTVLENAVAVDPLIFKDLFYVSGVRLGSNIQQLENMSLKAANRKVAHQLAYYAGVFGVKSENGISLSLPLTHQNLADILNLARETVTHCMVRLQEKGLITNDKNITILDIEKLKRAFR